MSSDVTRVLDLLDIVNANLGNMEYMADITLLLRQIASQVGMYGLNKFSSPSAFIKLSSTMDSIYKQYERFVGVQTHAKELMLRMNLFKQQHPDSEEEVMMFVDKLKPEIDDVDRTLPLVTEQFIFFLKSIKTFIAPEVEKLKVHVDIIDDFYKRKNIRAKGGNKYTITFKIVSKDYALGKSEHIDEK